MDVQLDYRIMNESTTLPIGGERNTSAMELMLPATRQMHKSRSTGSELSSSFDRQDKDSPSSAAEAFAQVKPRFGIGCVPGTAQELRNLEQSPRHLLRIENRFKNNNFIVKGSILAGHQSVNAYHILHICIKI